MIQLFTETVGAATNEERDEIAVVDDDRWPMQWVSNSGWT